MLPASAISAAAPIATIPSDDALILPHRANPEDGIFGNHKGQVMWVFGYGSLMWDGWEAEFGCLRSAVADLPGYQRVFNKASVRNWGTRTVPGPTLKSDDRRWGLPGNGL